MVAMAILRVHWDVSEWFSTPLDTYSNLDGTHTHTRTRARMFRELSGWQRGVIRTE
jgi:hypothetical protein